MKQASRSTRRQLGQFGLALVAAASMVLIQPAAHAQSKKDSVVVGMILGPLAEAQLRNAISIGEGSAMVFLQRPMSVGLLLVVLAVLLVPQWLKRRA